jgi:hypothetical protein
MVGLLRSHLLHETIEKRRPFHMRLLRFAHICWDLLATLHALQQQSTANALSCHISLKNKNTIRVKTALEVFIEV